MRASRILAASAALLALVLLPAAAGAQLLGTTVSTRSVSLRILVYPDGSIQLAYRLYALVTLPPGSNASGHKILVSLEEHGRMLPNGSRATMVLDAALQSGSLASKLQGVSLVNASLKVLHRMAGSAEELAASAHIYYVANGTPAEVTIDKLLVQRSNATLAVVEVVATLKGVKLASSTGSSGSTPSISEINEKLASRGLGFIKVVSLGVEMIQGNRTRITARAVVDISKMIAEAEAQGMPASDAKQLEEMITHMPSFTSETTATLRLERHGGLLEISMHEASTSRGNMTAYLRFEKRMSRLQSELISYLLRAYAAAVGNMKLAEALSVVRLQPAATMPAIEDPPFNTTLSLKVKSLPNGSIVLSVDYLGPRLLATTPAASPSAKAETLLTLLSMRLVELRSQLQRLNVAIPGAASLVPATALVEPAAPGVKVSQTSVPLASLSAVRIEITGAAHTATASSTATSTAAATATTAASSTATSSATAPATTTASAVSTTVSTTTTAAAPSRTTATRTTAPAPARPSATAAAPASPTSTSTQSGSSGLGVDILAASMIIGAAIVVAASISRRRR